MNASAVPTRPHRVLLVHGWAGSSRVFDSLRERVPAGLATLAGIDLAGFGAGPRRSEYALDAWVAEVVAAALAAAPCVLLGHSFGGEVAALAALAEPDAVAGLVVVSASVGFASERLPDSSRRAAHRLAERAMELRTGGRDLAAMVTGAVLESAAEHVPALLEDARAADPAALHAAVVSSFEVDFDRVLHGRMGLPFPALVVYGGQDRRWGEATALMAEVLAAPSRVIAGAAHYPMLEAPDEFAEVVRDFLEGLG